MPSFGFKLKFLCDRKNSETRLRWVTQISKVDRLPFAADDAEGFKAVLDAVAAQVAFSGLFFSFIEFYGSLGAGVQAGPAAITQFFIENHDAVIRL